MDKKKLSLLISFFMFIQIIFQLPIKVKAEENLKQAEPLKQYYYQDEKLLSEPTNENTNNGVENTVTVKINKESTDEQFLGMTIFNRIYYTSTQYYYNYFFPKHLLDNSSENEIKIVLYDIDWSNYKDLYVYVTTNKNIYKKQITQNDCQNIVELLKEQNTITPNYSIDFAKEGLNIEESHLSTFDENGKTFTIGRISKNTKIPEGCYNFQVYARDNEYNYLLTKLDFRLSNLNKNINFIKDDCGLLNLNFNDSSGKGFFLKGVALANKYYALYRIFTLNNNYKVYVSKNINNRMRAYTNEVDGYSYAFEKDCVFTDDNILNFGTNFKVKFNLGDSTYYSNDYIYRDKLGGAYDEYGNRIDFSKENINVKGVIELYKDNTLVTKYDIDSLMYPSIQLPNLTGTFKMIFKSETSLVPIEPAETIINISEKQLNQSPYNIEVESYNRDSIKIIWDYNIVVDHFNIYRSESQNGTFVKIGETNEKYYIDTTAEKGKEYFYKVSAVNSLGESPLSYSNWKKAKIAEVNNNTFIFLINKSTDISIYDFLSDIEVFPAIGQDKINYSTYFYDYTINENQDNYEIFIDNPYNYSAELFNNYFIKLKNIIYRKVVSEQDFGKELLLTLDDNYTLLNLSIPFGDNTIKINEIYLYSNNNIIGRIYNYSQIYLPKGMYDIGISGEGANYGYLLLKKDCTLANATENVVYDESKAKVMQLNINNSTTNNVKLRNFEVYKSNYYNYLWLQYNSINKIYINNDMDLDMELDINVNDDYEYAYKINKINMQNNTINVGTNLKAVIDLDDNVYKSNYINDCLLVNDEYENKVIRISKIYPSYQEIKGIFEIKKDGNIIKSSEESLNYNCIDLSAYNGEYELNFSVNNCPIPVLPAYKKINVTEDRVVLDKPTGTVTCQDGKVLLTWNKITGARGYNIYRLKDTEQYYEKIAVIEENENTVKQFIDTYVISGTTYEYRISAYNSSGEGSWSDALIITIPKNGVKVTGVTLDKTELKLNIGQTERLIATITPEDADNKDLIWTSSNSDVAVVDVNGNVAALNEGTTVITAKTVDGGFTASCTVTVEKPQTNVVYGDINFDGRINISDALMLKSYLLSLMELNTIQYQAGDVNGDKNITVSDYLLIKQFILGKITKFPIENAYVKVTGIKLDKIGAILKVNDTLDLNAIIFPDNATYKIVSWTSSNNDVAQINNGKVNAKSVGTAEITAVTVDGGYTAKFYITVTNDNINAILSVNSTGKLQAQIVSGKSNDIVTVTIRDKNGSLQYIDQIQLNNGYGEFSTPLDAGEYTIKVRGLETELMGLTFKI